MKLYHFTMVDNGRMVRDFAPYQKTLSDGTIQVGLLDLVEGKFYTSPSGAFLAGPVLGEQVSLYRDGSILTKKIIER